MVGSRRRDFDVPKEDAEHLEARGLPWETLHECGSMWVLVHEFPIPDGYKSSTATVAIRVPSNYPTAALDMVYFNPSMVREDGISIAATQATVNIAGVPFQRWSRHRTAQNPWRPGIDGIATHLSLVEEWLRASSGKE